jgi:hypothetical protein
MKNSKGREEYEIDFERVFALVSKYDQIKKSGEKYEGENGLKILDKCFEELGKQ